MGATGDYFRQLWRKIGEEFTAQPVKAKQECPDKAIQEWRKQHEAEIKEVLADQRALLQKKRQELELWDKKAQEAFKTSFGTTSDDARKTIIGRIDKLLALNQKMTIDNFRPADPHKPGRFAFVYPNDATHTVYLDEEFKTASRTGEDSKAGVITHEMSHFVDIGRTYDKFENYNNGYAVYGIADSHALAKTNPELALYHADSFEYYVEQTN